MLPVKNKIKFSQEKLKIQKLIAQKLVSICKVVFKILYRWTQNTFQDIRNVFK
jgi:hypothetical protein